MGVVSAYFDLVVWFGKAKQVVFRPGNAFRTLRRSPFGWRSAARFLGETALAYHLIAAVFLFPLLLSSYGAVMAGARNSLCSPVAGLQSPLCQAADPTTIVTGLAVNAGIRAGFTIGSGVVLVFLMHVMVLLLGGRGLRNTFYPVAYSYATLPVIGWVPYFVLLWWRAIPLSFEALYTATTYFWPLLLAPFGLYALYIQFVGIAELHGFKRGTAAAAVIIPAAGLIALQIVVRGTALTPLL